MTTKRRVPEVIVVGAGVRGIGDLTLSSLEVLRNSDAILSLAGTSYSARLLNLPRVEDILHLYKDGVADDVNYAALLRKIMSVAKLNGTVTVLLPGHPRVGVTTLQQLQEMHDQGACSLVVHEGISSFDVMMNDLGRDPLEYGSLIVDANRLLLFDLTIDTSVDVYVYHVCSVGQPIVARLAANTGSNLKELKAKLAKSYPLSHEVSLVNAGLGDVEGNSFPTCPLGELDSVSALIDYNTSLFIPAIPVDVVNLRFLNSMVEAICAANEAKNIRKKRLAASIR